VEWKFVASVKNDAPADCEPIHRDQADEFRAEQRVSPADHYVDVPVIDAIEALRWSEISN
jgi:hypothetical protein